MRRLMVLIGICMLAFSVQAQSPYGSRGNNIPVQRHSLTFEAQQGELFTVFIDGNEINRMPQSIVSILDISSQTHEVVVVLKRPASKAAVLQLRPSEARVKVSVAYSQSSEQLLLYTPSINLPDSPRLSGPLGTTSQATIAAINPDTSASSSDSFAPRPATDDEVTVMAANMQRRPFDSDRLALGKVYVVSSVLSSAQIARLAQVIDYTGSQVDFLKYAYPYCSDKANYGQAVEVLLSHTDRKKVLDYIATQP